MSTDLKKESMEQAIAEWAEHIRPYKESGLERAYMLVDRATGRYLSITLWESEAKQRQNATSTQQVKGRDTMTEKYFTAPPTPACFEVVSVIE